jgi:Fe-S cluster assembly ATP-binding protein
VTHYQRILNYIVPDVVHVLYQGQIIKTGDKSLALEIEERGYDWLLPKSDNLPTLTSAPLNVNKSTAASPKS